MNPSSTEQAMRLLEGRVLHEDNHLLILNKRAGEIVQGDKSGDEPLLELARSYIRETCHKNGNVFCGLVHRIDRPVSGAVVFARTSKALSRMNELVKQRRISKVYWAIVEGVPAAEEATLVHYVQKNERTNKSYVSETDKPGWQRAELRYLLIGTSERYSLLEVELHTGRHHQIRAQLAAMGNPIKGDVKYGARRACEDGSIMLHARSLRFEHPVSHQVVSVFAEPFNPLFRKIGGLDEQVSICE